MGREFQGKEIDHREHEGSKGNDGTGRIKWSRDGMPGIEDSMERGNYH